MRTRRSFFKLAALCGVAVLLAACGSSDKGEGAAASSGPRLSVLDAGKKLTADASLSHFVVSLPEPAVNRDWAQAGGNTEHAPGHPALSPVPETEWSESIGSGSGSDYKLLSTPVVSGNAIYTQDSRGRVSAFRLQDGDRYWRVDTAPPDRDGEAMGGGVAVDGNVVYVTTGFGEILALRAANGDILWRRMVGKPIRSAPTIAEGRVYAITIENETYALDAKSGLVLWRHSGIAESATLMGASSPAVHGDTVVVAYSSGELFGLRSQNGRVVWGDVLAVPTKVGALPAIADIRGLPVIDQNRVYAISHSGRMAAIDERSGERVWETDIGGVNTPAMAENTVFIVTNDNELIALERASGRVLWLTQLRKNKDPDDKSSRPVSWFGPVLAGGRLWLTNSLGELAAYAPETGFALFDQELAGAFFLPPVVADRAMLLLDDSGDLHVLR